MIALALLYVVAAIVLRHANMPRATVIAMLPLIALDVLGNMLLSGASPRTSWRNTMSATAWAVRAHRFFFWTHALIDALFGADHCRQQYVRETAYGSVWLALRAQWKAVA